MYLFWLSRSWCLEIVVRTSIAEVLVKAKEHAVTPVGGEAPVVCTGPYNPSWDRGVGGDPHFENDDGLAGFDEADDFSERSLSVDLNRNEVGIIDVDSGGGVNHQPFEGWKSVEGEGRHGRWGKIERIRVI